MVLYFLYMSHCSQIMLLEYSVFYMSVSFVLLTLYAVCFNSFASYLDYSSVTASAGDLIIWRGFLPHWCFGIEISIYITVVDQMPSLSMKTKSSTVSLRDKNSLRVCQRSSMICKRSCCHVRDSQQGAEFSTCIQNSHDGKQLHWTTPIFL